ncbi:hypothetical protein FOS14_02090 [Skermania sp. ID1734]|uniref:MaoC family dehydratase N-terminal domain-containing protein n=1 Tax=Skermania sp. ID1734 TaxID=2597516 RepID=UPI001180CD04|nr:MaoC family dehydratase N-terminal domain-containing protein [Skermania sp. ID1734]TSE02193.1 hypothetical protein FOS14_02090 [Skermania sp. ID1734]
MNTATLDRHSFDVYVDPERIREFADATQAHDAAYWDTENPVVPPTFLAAQVPYGSAEFEGVLTSPVEQNFWFAGPPPHAGDRLTAVSLVTATETVNEFFDPSGRLVAETWRKGVDSAVGMRAASRLAAYATDWLGAESVRRFRTRIWRELAPGEELVCTGTVQQRYRQDGESRVDVSVLGVNRSGEVVARAWATFAE